MRRSERFLAWLRTGLSLMGVGFAVAKFGLFVRQLEATEAHTVPHGVSFSDWSGIGLVVIGVLVNLSAITRYYKIVRELREGSWRPGRVSRSAAALAVVLAVAGVGMVVYLALASH